MVGLGALAAIGGGVMLARKMLSSQLPKMQHVRLKLCHRTLGAAVHVHPSSLSVQHRVASAGSEQSTLRPRD